MQKLTIEKKLLRVQEYFGNKGTGIWGNTDCERCGACCYYFEIKETASPHYEKCKFLDINGIASCERHEKAKPKECVNHFCGALRGPGYRRQLQRIAIDTLKTREEQDFLQLVERYEEAIQGIFNGYITPLMEKCSKPRPGWTVRDYFRDHYYDKLKRLDFEAWPLVRKFGQSNELTKLQKQCLISLVIDIAGKEFTKDINPKEIDVWEYTLDWLCKQG